MRKEYEMSQEQLQGLLDASKPVPYMIVGSSLPRTPQENSNAAWATLGREMGFDHMTVQPVDGKGILFFTAKITSLVVPKIKKVE